MKPGSYREIFKCTFTGDEKKKARCAIRNL